VHAATLDVSASTIRLLRLSKAIADGIRGAVHAVV
jgi:hypothetical protein